MNGKIYCITCTINNKRYIGQTKKTLKIRIKKHKKDDKQAINHTINKYS